VDVGAASVRLVRAGNAHAERISANVGVGGLELDLGGEWTRDIVIDARVAMGKFTLRLPSDVGIVVESNSFLLDFDKTGLRKRGNAWYSDDYDAAPRKVRLDLNGALGKLAILRDTK
jgi:predicted membrane protein